ncbi:MAG: family 65 glycosyl hydrolase domain-containing protein [Eubacteriales bacterium]|nr:family 65 glycosyl hydrolase domain-containing protein [Eubacteriales bacterium]
MKRYFKLDPWKIIEDSFPKDTMRISESIMSLGNGSMGLRGNFEEDYSGDSHRGTYIGGVWFPDKTRVGWWKNGYPEYFGKAINAANLIGLHVFVDGVKIDAAKLPVKSFSRSLDMQTGILKRKMTLSLKSGEITIETERFVSMASKELLALRYTLISSFDAEVKIQAYLDGNVHNEDSNYDESFWDMLKSEATPEYISIINKTKENPFKTPRFTVAAASSIDTGMEFLSTETLNGYAEATYQKTLKAGESVRLDKLICVLTDRDYSKEELSDKSKAKLKTFKEQGYVKLKQSHERAWLNKWDMADISIAGDDASQQGIRFNLFQLFSTYTGDDARLNIGPKGYTGEKYGGATYWDTEAFCFPVYLATSGEDVAKNLLLYRYYQLPKAYENAKKQGLDGALYPMVTFDGTECHNEWEITFMELHRNGAMALAIFNYTTYTGDFAYLKNEGLEVLYGIAKFWADRVHWNENKQCYMLHGVTGPNEYENNVNNNWYTNRVAAWCLNFFCQSAALAGEERCKELGLTYDETEKFKKISQNMYYAEDKDLGIFVQHDTFLDKVLKPVSSIPSEERPINQHWSWDKILRSCYIKQADVLQGLYALGHLYDLETKKRNFEFYEPMTVHESSLSPCVHAILAAELGKKEKAVEMYLRTARLDLDNINNDTQDGLHITSMSGSWLAIVQGFAGMRTTEALSFNPMLPDIWESYSFKFLYRKRLIMLHVGKDEINVFLEKGNPVGIKIYGKEYTLDSHIKVLYGDRNDI